MESSSIINRNQRMKVHSSLTFKIILSQARSMNNSSECSEKEEDFSRPIFKWLRGCSSNLIKKKIIKFRMKFPAKYAILAYTMRNSYLSIVVVIYFTKTV